MIEDLNETTSKIRRNINWQEELHNTSFIIFDTETTGLNPFRGDEIISIGAVVMEKGRVLSSPNFYQLVNPGRPVSTRAKKITGLNDTILRDKPGITPVILDFLKFCGPRILVAHNALFDLAFLNLKLGELIDERIVNPVIDTVLLTQAFYYQIGDYSLENLSSHFDLDLEGRHNALSDALITAGLFKKLLPLLKEKDIKTLPHLEDFFSSKDLTRGYPLVF